jgi:polysaccharide pyruvyl transferase WcaK-like protein
MIRTRSPESRPRSLARTRTASVDHALARRCLSFAGAWGREIQLPPNRIGVFGLFGCGNIGNDGSLEAMLMFLRRVRSNTGLICFCQSSHSAAARVSKHFRVAATPLAFPRPASGLLRVLDNLSLEIPRQLASLFRAIKYARRLDLLILPGTGNLDDYLKRPLGMPLAIFGWCLAAKLCGTRIAFVSVGAGPIDHPLSRWLMKSAAAMADYRSYRDTASKTFMESIGLDTRSDAVYPDIAFKLPAPAAPVRQDAEERPLIVGVGVMTYKGWHADSNRGAAIYAAYLAKITKLVLWLLDRGHPVRILMGETTDRQAVADVMTKVASARPHLPQYRIQAEPMHSLHDLMHQIAEADVVVATRFHNVVCALKLGKPTVSIGYSPKNDALMAEIGMGRFCQHIERLDVDLLIDQFSELIADPERYARSIRNANLIYQERLNRQDALLATRFLSDSAEKVARGGVIR